MAHQEKNLHDKCNAKFLKYPNVVMKKLETELTIKRRKPFQIY
jgi:hypothetical protein